MKIVLSRPMTCGKVMVPMGEYMVAPRTDIQAIQLTGGGKEYKLPCVKRPGRARPGRTLQITFYSMDSSNWTLSVSIPKMGEFAAFLVVEKGRPDR